MTFPPMARHFTSADGVQWVDRGIGMSPWSVCPCGANVLPTTALLAMGGEAIATRPCIFSIDKSPRKYTGSGA